MKVCAIVDLAARESEEYCFLHDSPEGFHVQSWKLTEGEAAGDEFPENAKIPMSSKERGIEIPDVVGNSRGFFIVSGRLKAVVEELGLPVEILPISILNHRKRVASRDHFILNPLGSFDCLDHDRSVIEYLDGEVVEVEKFAFSPKKVAKLPHMFRVKESPRTIVLCDDVLKAWLGMTPEVTNLIIEPFEIPPR